MEFHGTDGFPETAIRLISGEVFDYADPMSAKIEYHDIAHSLARSTRFTGQVGMVYHVANHALFVALLVALHYNQPQFAYAALHHDDVEAFTQDWPSPLKRFVKARGFDYKKELERPIESALAQKFGWVLDDLHAGVIKDADRLAFVTEGTILKPGFDRRDQGFDDIDDETIQAASRYMLVTPTGTIEAILQDVNEKLELGADPVKVLQKVASLGRDEDAGDQETA